jgi:hypothetical protein
MAPVRWGGTQSVCSQACAARVADAPALPTCRYLAGNSFRGTLPPQWSTMTALTALYVRLGALCGKWRCSMSNAVSSW